MREQLGKQVLVVDDEHDICEAVAEVLADEDYRAIAASNGQDALEQLRAMDEKPCAILLDLTMPVMNGFQFRALQQADPALQCIPVVLLTANFQETEVADLRAAAFVRKPFNPEALLEAVQSARRAASSSLTGSSWQRVAGDRERWERAGFGAVEPRGPTLWVALPTCGHDYFSAVSLAEARQQLDEHAGLCFVCWYRTHAFRRALRRGQSTPPDGSALE
jgi:CheY-like chemotaxis protein